jgi:Macrocin-O-methyltransferase (TylF)
MGSQMQTPKSTKWLLTCLGSRLSSAHLNLMQSAVNYCRLGHWMKWNGFNGAQRLGNRFDVFDVVLREVADKKVLYLEFGVYRGESIRFWSEGLRNPESCLHGFDSFEGLPEEWGSMKQGSFDVGGTIPQLPDKRVKFFKGWFDQVLPSYVLPEHDVLVINMDADLYSSTLYVLRHLRKYIRPGVFIYFDELHTPDHEPRAFGEFIKETNLQFRLLATDKTLAHAFFQCMES